MSASPSSSSGGSPYFGILAGLAGLGVFLLLTRRLRRGGSTEQNRPTRGGFWLDWSSSVWRTVTTFTHALLPGTGVGQGPLDAHRHSGRR